MDLKKIRPSKVKKSPKKKKAGNCLAIDFGSRSLKFAVGENIGNKIRTEKLFYADIPKDVYENGHIRNSFELESIIQRVLSENEVQVKNVICTIESTDIINRELIVPVIDHEDMMDMITYEIGQYLPIDISSYVLQYKIIREFEDEGVKKYELIVAALPQTIAESMHKLLTDAGLNPIAMDINSNCIDKLFDGETSINSHFRIDDKTAAFLDMGYNSINVVILEKGVYRFNRIIKAGCGNIDEIISNYTAWSLEDSGKNKSEYFSKSIMDLSAEYDTIQKTNAYVIEDEASDNKKVITAESLQQIDYWIDEINKVFKYYTSRSIDNTIDEIYIYGGCTYLADLDKYMQDKIGIPVQTMRSAEKVNFVKKEMEGELSMYVNVIGSLIRK